MQLREEVQQHLRSARSWSAILQEIEQSVMGALDGLGEDAARAQALYELGVLCDECFLRPERALAHYQAAFKLDPTDLRAAMQARLIYTELGDWETVTALLGVELRAAEGADRARLKGALGMAQLDLGLGAEAAENLAAALAAQPNDEELREAHAAATHDRGAWEDEVAALTDEALASEPRRAAALLLRVARILRLEAPDDPRREEALRAAIGFDLQNERVAALLEAWLGASGQLDELMALHEERSERCEDARTRVALCRRFAMVWEQHFADGERAAYFLHKALVAGWAEGGGGFSGQLAAFERVGQVLGAHGAWTELLALADHGLASGLGEEDAVVLAAMAGWTAWQQLNDLERARAYLKLVVARHPEDEMVREFERQVVADAEAAATLQHPDSVVSATEIVEPATAAAGPSATLVADAPLAAEVQSMPTSPVELAPATAAENAEPTAAGAPEPEIVPTPAVEEVPVAVREEMEAARAVEAEHPERAIEAWKKVVAAHPTWKAPRAELVRVLRAAERWNVLVEVLKEQAEKIDGYTNEEKIAAYFELAEVYRERLRIDAMAMSALNGIVALDPRNRAALDALEAQLERMKRWPDLIKTLEKKAEASDDPAEQVALYGRMAALLQEKFSNAAEAIKAYEKVLEIEPRHAEAIGFLKANYEKRRDWEKLIGVHLREIEPLPREEQAARYLDVARLASEKLKRPAVSIPLWAKVLEFEPDHADALSELEKLYEREKQWDELAEVLERQAVATSDAAKKAALLFKLGVLFTDRANDPDRAVMAWKALLIVEPDNRRAQDALKRLYTTQKRWDELEAFYAERDKYDEFVRVLERQAETEDDETKLTLHARIAELYRDRLGKPDRALRAYEKVLQLDPNNLAAAEALIPLCEEARDLRRLATALEIQLGHTPAGEHTLRIERLRRLLELSEGQLRDKGAAFGWALKAFGEARPGEAESAWVRDEVERLAKESGGFAELVEAYETGVAGAFSGEPLPLLRVVARVYEEELGDRTKAIETNRRVVKLDENDAQAVAALERLYLATQQYPELLAIYEKKLALEVDPAACKEIRYRMASLFEDELHDGERALAAYQAILADGDELPALGALDRLYVVKGAWRELEGVLRRELALVGGDAGPSDPRVDLMFRLGALREGHLDDVGGAVVCYRDLLSIDPSHAGACTALERLLRDPARQAQHLVIADILDPIYREQGEWAKLVGLEELRLAAEPERGTPRRIELLLHVGELYAHSLDDAEHAFETYSRCFREQPVNATARAELARLADELGAWERLVSLYQAALDDGEKPLDDGLRRELLLAVADARDTRLDQAERAIEDYRAAQVIAPNDPAPLEALERIYTRLERWSDLVEVHRRKVELTAEPAEREVILLRMAWLWEEMLHNVDEAIGTYQLVLAQDGGNAKALRALDRLYQAKGAWRELADNLSRRLALTDERGERVELLVRLAELREHQLGEVEAAVDTYRQVLELQPEHAGAMTALERLIAQPAHELAVATIFEPIYRARGEWRKLVECSEIMVRHAQDPRHKIELLHGIAELYELGEEPERAFETSARALREEPGLPETQQRIERLARLGERWTDLVGLYREQIEQGKLDVEQRVALETRVAQIHDAQLSDDDAAAQAWQRVLALDPANLEAAEALEVIHLRNAAYADLVEVQLRKAEMVTLLDEKKALWFKAAQLFEEVLESPTRAIEVYCKVVALDEQDERALVALERLYAHLGQWENLRDLLTRKAELAADADEKKRILFALGELHVRELKDPARAIETYVALLELDPEERQALTALDRLYEQTARWYDLLQIIEREVELARSSAETVELKHRMGRLWERELKDLPRAVEAYREALAYDGMHEPTLAALDGIAHGSQEPVLAAQVLEPIFEATGEWEKLVDLYEVMVRHADDGFRRVELLHRIAEIEERQLGRATRAFDAYGRALRDDPVNELTLAELERLAGSVDAWADLARLYEEEAKKLIEPPRQVEMLLRLARVYDAELQPKEPAAGEQAIATYRRVVEVDPDERVAVYSLDRLYQTAERWNELADVLRHELRLAESESDRLDVQFRLGQLYELDLKDLDKAIEVYREILAADPTHGPALTSLEMLFSDGTRQSEIAQILEPLYRAAEQWERLVHVQDALLAHITLAEERQAALQRLAELCEQKLGEHGGREAALRYWAQALREAPLSELAGSEVERLAEELGAWDDVVALYVDMLNAHVQSQGVEVPAPGDETARQLLLRLAVVFDEKQRDAARAEDAYLRVLQIDDKDATALAALDRLYLGAGMWAELADVLARRIAITTVTDELVELHLRLGQVHAEALGAADPAIASYNAILELEPRHRTALEALVAIYEHTARWSELFGTYEKLLDVASGDDEMAYCYARMAQIAGAAFAEREGEAAARQRAIELWGRVIDLRGEEPEALDHLAALHTEAGAWNELVEVLERRIRISPEVGEQIALYFQLGRVQREQLHQDRAALDAFYQVLQLDPGHIEALRIVAAIHRDGESWSDLGDTLRQLAELPHDGSDAALTDEERKGLYAELGRIEGELLLRPQEAIDAWCRVLELDGGDLPAYAALEHLYTQEARWEECIGLLERKAAVVDVEAQRIDVLMRIAMMWEEKVGDMESAARAYERVLAIAPSQTMASERLEAIYRDGGQWEKLIELLLQRGEFVDKARKIELLQGIARIYERELSDREGAFVVLQAAFKEDYSNEATAHELERIATIDGKWTDLVADYSHVVQTIAEPNVAADLWVKIGRWYGDRLGHIEYAIASEKQALALAPENKEALAHLADFYRKTSRWPELAEVLARHAAIEEEPRRRVELNLAIADLHEGVLADSGTAIRAYREAVAADPRCIDALNALERLHRKGEQWPELVDVLGRKAQVLDEPEQIAAVKLQIGTLHEEKTGDAQHAIAAYRDVLTVDPENHPALRALERLYEKTDSRDDFLANLERQLDVAASDSERVAVLERMARAQEEKFNKRDRACESLEKILEIDPRHDAAYVGLERLYQQEGRHADLVDTLRRHIDAVRDPAARIELYAKMGETYEEDLKDVDRALEAYSDILSFDPDHLGALAALGRLYERNEDWTRAVDALGRTLQLTDDEAARVELHYRIGRLHEERLGDSDTAEARYNEALSIDPRHLPAMRSLIALYQQRGDWLKAAQMMVRADAFTSNLVEKVRLLQDAARIYREKLDDEAKAAELFAQALEADPEHAESGEALADIWFREAEAGNTGRWAQLEPVLDMLARKADKNDPAALNLLHYRLARTADALGNADKALRHYKQAYDLDSTYLPTLLGRAALLFKQQDWEGAFKIYQTVLVHHRDAQSPEQTVELFHRMGEIKEKEGEPRKALNMYEKALELDPTHRPTLLAVVGLQTGLGDYEAVIRTKRALMPVADEAERFRLYEEIGDLYHEKLKSPQKAIEAYDEALHLRPDNHVVLHKVLELYTETRQWQSVVDVLQRFVELEKSPVRRGKYHEATAKIFRDELKQPDDAMDYFNRALDAFFEKPESVDAAAVADYLKPFQAIDRIVTAAKDWKSQERAYRKMIKRMPADGLDGLKVMLWHALGEVYRSRLKDYPTAVQAFEVAAKLEPGNAQRREILAELYVMAGPDQARKAVGEHMFLLRQDPFRLESYRALRKLYMDLRQYDRAWGMCNALVFLQKADAEETAFYEQYRQKGFVKARQPLTAEQWAKLTHPDEDRYVGAIFATVRPALALAQAVEHKQYGLKRKDKLELATHQALFSKVFTYVAQTLGVVPPPEVYLKPDQPGAIQLLNLKEKNLLLPSVVVGAELLQGRSDKELAFPVAQFLSTVRPEHYLKRLLPTQAHLRIAFLSALKLVMPKFAVPAAEAQAVAQSAAGLLPMMQAQPALLEQLALVVQRFIQTKAEIDLHKWAQAVELTAHRAAFLLANDLVLATRYIQAEPTTVGGMAPKEKVKELLLFAISEEYFDLRQELGIVIAQ